MKRSPAISILLFVLLISLSAAQDEGGTVLLPEEAASLRFEYEVLRAEIMKPVEELNLHYRNRLSDLKLEFQHNGDLDGVLKVTREDESIKNAGKPPFMGVENDPPKLVEVRTIYEKARERLEVRLQPKLRANDEEFLGKLDAMKLGFTKEGRLDEALAVKALMEEISGEGKPSEPLNGSVSLKMQIDGVSHLYMRGDDLWYDHSEGKGSPPGLHEGEIPTYINDDVEWMPVWNEKTTNPFPAGLGLPTSEPVPKLNLEVKNGRGWAEVVEQPSAKNDYTAKIELRDETKLGKGFLGSDWLEIEISW